MTISVNWLTKVISIPQSDLTNISGTLYELDTDWLRLELKAIEDSQVGMVFPDTHQHNTEVTVAGTTYARTIEIINGYSITFMPNSQWTVKLIGSNNNIFDVENGVLNQNQVQVIPTNSAGLQTVSSGSGLSSSEQTKLNELWELSGLNSEKPKTVTRTSRVVGDIFQVISGDGETTTTVTRQ